MKQVYLELTSTDPFFNLACEQYVFDSLPRDRSYLILWQNDNTIVIGKYQNTYSEIHAEYVKQHDIKIARRLSGGGAVYHDLGNLNYTIITDAADMSELNMRAFCEPVVRALTKIGVKAEVNGRNDITINGLKFSGNSQYIKNDRVMHHGTIMFDSDLEVVGKALNVDETKIKAKGIKSVRSRVTNVSAFLPDKKCTLEDFKAALIGEIFSENRPEQYILTEDDCAEIQHLRDSRYATWEWNYGFSPQCTVTHKKRFEGCGMIEAGVEIEEGKIKDITFYGDFFSFSEPAQLAERLKGCRPCEEDYAEILKEIDASRYFCGINNRQLMDLLLYY